MSEPEAIPAEATPEEATPEEAPSNSWFSFGKSENPGPESEKKSWLPWSSGGKKRKSKRQCGGSVSPYIAPSTASQYGGRRRRKTRRSRKSKKRRSRRH